MAIRTIVFDFGNVLAYFSHQQAAAQLADYADGVSAEEIQLFLFDYELEDAYERGAIDTASFRALVRERCRLNCDDDQFDVAYANMFLANAETMVAAVTLVNSYRVLLLSNTTDLHSRWFLRQYALVLDRFHGIVLSHEVGIRKPQRGIYEHCLRLANCEASECLFIDDMPVNVEAARACGWQGLVYRPNQGFAEQLEALGIALPDSGLRWNDPPES